MLMLFWLYVAGSIHIHADVDVELLPVMAPMVDNHLDKDGLMHLLDHDVREFTDLQSALIFHVDDRTPNETIATVSAALKPLATISFENYQHVGFGITHTSPAVKRELGLDRIPGLYLHPSHPDVVRYQGDIDTFEILDFVLEKTGSKINDWREVPVRQEEGTYVVNKFNYRRFTTDSVFSMVYFYDNECTVCEGSSHIMAEVAEAFKKDGEQVVDILFGKYRASDMNYVAEHYNVTSLPTIVYFANLVSLLPKMYTGDMRVFDMRLFVIAMTTAKFTNNVLSLTGERFKRYLSMKPAAFVKFTSNQDKDMLHFNEDYYAAAATLARTWKHPCVFVTFNITQYPGVVESDMDTTTALYLYKWGMRYTYTPAYNYKNDLEKMERVSSQLVRTVDDLNPLMKGRTEQVVIVGIFMSNSDPEMQKFEQFALNNRHEVELLQTTDRRTARRFNVKKSSVVLMYPTDCVTDTLESSHRVIDIASLAVAELTQAIFELIVKPNNFPLICGSHYRGLNYKYNVKALVRVYIHLDWGVDGYSHMKYWSDKLKPLARKYRSNNIYVVFSDEDMHYETIHYLGLRGGSVSEILFTIEEISTKRRYSPTPHEIDEAGSIIELIEDYLTRYLNNQLTSVVRSEPTPGPWQSGKLNKIVGTTVEDFMQQKGMFVVLLVVQEHDSNYLKLEKHATTLAAHYTSAVLFGKLNARMNHVFFKLSAGTNAVFVSNDGIRLREYPDRTEEMYNFQELLREYDVVVAARDEL